MALYAFDGTWNDSRAPESERNLNKDTNVHRFRAVYGKKHFYLDGVGSRGGTIGKLIGGFSGAGAQKRISEQFQNLKEQLGSGDNIIDIIGYSRGAAIARMFVHHIKDNFDELIDSSGNNLSIPPTVRFLGLFDTVASFGIPWSQNEHDFVRDIPDFVDHTYHAMALDETRETFGIERCLGDRDKITEVWFRGGHGDIGGNATFVERHSVEHSNRKRSDIALQWMLKKGKACGLPVPDIADHRNINQTDVKAPITALDELFSIGNAGTLSRRIHLGDLMHYSIEQTELTRGIDGRQLRRINVLTRIEDEVSEENGEGMNWIPPFEIAQGPDNLPISDSNPSIVQLSLRRYPFDVLPARTWAIWLKRWGIDNADPVIIDKHRLNEFWAPTDADQALAWDIYVELQTRIAVQNLGDNEGDDLTALESIVKLFGLSRESMSRHGVGCANTGTLINAFLNKYVRNFTANWHKRSLSEKWKENPGQIHSEFREDLKSIQPELKKLAGALSHVADAQL